MESSKVIIHHEHDNASSEVATRTNQQTNKPTTRMSRSHRNNNDFEITEVGSMYKLGVKNPNLDFIIEASNFRNILTF